MPLDVPSDKKSPLARNYAAVRSQDRPEGRKRKQHSGRGRGKGHNCEREQP